MATSKWPMAPIIFKCPTTGMKVQWETEEDSRIQDDAVLYQSIKCPGCTRIHFINRLTGKLLGEK